MDKRHEVVKLIINKELEKHGVDFDYVAGLEKGMIGDKLWCQHYTFNSKYEYSDWKDYSISLIRKKLKWSKALAEKEFAWIDLCYGLKQNYNATL